MAADSVIATRSGTHSTPTISGVISGSGNLTLTPAGTTLNLTLPYANPGYSGSWSEGTNATLTLSNAADLTVANAISDTGNFAKSGVLSTTPDGAGFSKLRVFIPTGQARGFFRFAGPP